MTTSHETQIVRRPADQVRPICTCGWLGTTCRSVADAQLEAREHEAQHATLAALEPMGSDAA